MASGEACSSLRRALARSFSLSLDPGTYTLGFAGLTRAETSLETARGRVRVRWEQLDGLDTLEIDVPDGAFAHVDATWDTKTPLSAGVHVLTRNTSA